MASDASIDTKDIRVSVQANGLIRRCDTGYLIAKLCEDVTYKDLPDEQVSELEDMLSKVDPWLEQRKEMQAEIDRLQAEVSDNYDEVRRYEADINYGNSKVGGLKKRVAEMTLKAVKHVEERDELKAELSVSQKAHARVLREIGPLIKADLADAAEAERQRIDAVLAALKPPPIWTASWPQATAHMRAAIKP